MPSLVLRRKKEKQKLGTSLWLPDLLEVANKFPLIYILLLFERKYTLDNVFMNKRLEGYGGNAVDQNSIQLGLRVRA